jgi:hypothetical protein
MNSAAIAPESESPWYRHFWPWFIVCLLGISVMASLVTVWIAVVNRDSLVSDDWYEDGTSINRRLERDTLARELEVVALLDFDSASHTIGLSLTGLDLGDLPSLQLTLSHPTIAARDQLIPLTRQADGRYQGVWASAVPGQWYATLAPAPSDIVGGTPDWQIHQRVTIADGDSIVLGISP